jgi:hypothetical protein
MRLLRTFHSIVFSLGLACAPALATDICGPLNGTLTSAGNPYVATCDISVAFGDTLNLDPGVEIRFQDATSLTVDGTLNAKGTAADGVLFTSNSGAPGPGIWNNITINGQGTFDYATVRYAQQSTVAGDAAFTNCTFEQNWQGLWFDPGSSGSVTGGSFSLSMYGLVISGDTSVTASGAVFDQNDIAGYLMGPNVYPVLSNLTVNENHTWYNGMVVEPGAGNWSKGGTWTNAGCPYVFQFNDLNFDSGTTFTVEAGTVIKVDSVSLNFQTLDVNGTSGSPVVFTSYRDDSVGGDTNADGGASFPSGGDWNFLTLNGPGSTLDYATVKYAQQSTVTGDAAFASCAFEQNQAGLWFDPGSSGSVTGGSFSFNAYGFVIFGDSSVSASGAVFDQNDIAGALIGPNVYPVLSNLTVNENHAWRNGIDVDPGAGNWSKSGTWTDAGCPYVMESNDLNFDPGVTFTVEAGAVIKMNSTTLNFDDLVVNGTSGSPVVFTSLLDDSVGGDTNADGGATSPGLWDWNGLALSGTGSTLDYATVKHAQQSTVTGDAAFTSCAFEQNQTGLQFDPGSSGSVTGGSFSLNDTGLVIYGDSSVTASGAVFDQNNRPGYLRGPNVYPVLSSLTVNENHTWLNGIEVNPGFSNWSKGGTWTDAGCPYVFQFNDLNFDPGVTFTVEAGVIIKTEGLLNVTFETLDVNGTSGSTVVFTSLRDDSVGGDTNADGGATSPGMFDWNGLALSGTGSTLDYATVKYAQQSTVTGDAAFTSCTFEQNQMGVWFEAGSSGSVTGGSFSLNSAGFMISGDTSVTASGAVFDQNDMAGYLMGPNVYPVLSNLTVNENHTWRNGIGADPGVSNWSKSGTWTDAGCPYVIEFDDLNFDPGVTFAVEAGVVIKVEGLLNVTFDSLDVNGTSGSPVVFTSLLDDSAGGDTNADGGATSPSQGDWNGLAINGPGSTLDYATVRYANETLVSGSADFTNCAFEGNLIGVRFEVVSSGSVTGGSFSFNDTGLAISEDTSVTASGAVFDQNGQAGYLMGPNVYPALSNLTVNENHWWYNGIVVDPVFSGWSKSGAWTDAGCPYVIEFDDLNFDPGVTFAVEAGAVIKVDSIGLNFDDLVVNGTSGSPVTFTSINDDSAGGDTNANGPTSGTPGDWFGISLNSGTTHTLDGVKVSYADIGLTFNGVTGTVDQSSFFRNTTGLSFELGGSAVVTNSGFAGNDTGVSVDALSLPDLGDLNDASPLNDGLNDFVCNTVHVSNANAATVLAENNWWGEAPPNPASIVGSVDYDPYLTGQSQPVLTGLTVSLVNGNDDVRLAWEDAAPACGYRVLRSEQPDSGFTDISGLLLANTYDDVGAGSSGIDYFYLVVMD